MLRLLNFGAGVPKGIFPPGLLPLSGNKALAFIVEASMKNNDSHGGAPPGPGEHVGYVRVSTVAPTLDQQDAALEGLEPPRPSPTLCLGRRMTVRV